MHGVISNEMRNRLKRLRKIRLHHEGAHILVLGAMALIFLNTTIILLFKLYHISCTLSHVTVACVVTLSVVVYGVVLNFFRCPLREFNEDTMGTVVASADGKVVVIEEVDENEYFHDRRLMISIFMSLFDVHANWIPLSGTVKMVKHHEGNFHCAWLPKASIENERSTIVITTPEGEDVLVRQIAGAVARRVVTYLQEGESYELDEHMGFIKFGSRVDVFLPLGTEVCVNLGQRVAGNETVIARLQ